MKGLFLDLDDCLVPWQKAENKNLELNKETLINMTEQNIKTIKAFCNRNKFKCFLSSSWSVTYEAKNGNLIPKKGYNPQQTEQTLLNIINKYLDFVKTDPFHDRVRFIKEESKNLNVALVIDDFDLSEKFDEDNIFFLRVINGEFLEEKLKKAEFNINIYLANKRS